MFRLVLRLGARLLAAGVVIGLVAGAATNRLLVNQLWNTSPHDVTTVVAAVTLVALIGLLACGVPARRAMRVDPMVALREE